MWLYNTVNAKTRTAFEKRAFENNSIISLVADDSNYTFKMARDNNPTTTA